VGGSGLQPAAEVANRIVTIGPSHPLVAGRSGRGVSVAVIDSGVHLGHPHVGGVSRTSSIAEDGTAGDDTVDRLGHGTAVLSAVHEKAPGAEIHVIKVFNATLSTTVTALVAALDRCAEEGVHLANLSLGITSAREIPELEAALGRCRDRGTIVVTALGDGNRPWRLGGLPGVVGVTSAADCPRDSIRLGTADGGRVRASASEFARPIPGVPPERNIRGVSLAVANVTGVLACALEGWDGESAEGLLGELMG